MDRIKQISLYIVWIILFFLISNFLIYVGLNSTYKDISRIDTNENIKIYQAEATKTDGRIRGIIENENTLGKDLKVKLYSKNGVKLSEKHIQLTSENIQNFELIFDTDNVKAYNLELVSQ